MTAQNNDDGFVKLKRYSSLMEAEVIKGLLESEGIRSIISGGHFNSLMPHVGAAANVMLLVPQFKLQAAQELLKQMEESGFEYESLEDAKSFADIETQESKEKIDHFNYAFRASFWGTAFLPLLGNLYSIFHFYKAYQLDKPAFSKHPQKFLIASIMNLFALVLWTIFLFQYISGKR